MSKFGEGLGIWEYKIGETEYKLKPVMEDVLELRKAMGGTINRKTGVTDLGVIDGAVFCIFERLVLKAEPNLTSEEKKELKEYIIINIDRIGDEMSIAFKQTTKEAVEKTREQAKQSMFGIENEDKKKL